MTKSFRLISFAIILLITLISCEKDNDSDKVEIAENAIELSISLSEHGTIINWEYSAGSSFKVFINGTAKSDLISNSNYIISDLEAGDIIKVKSYNKDSKENANGKINYEFTIESIVGKFLNPDHNQDYKEFANDGFGLSNYSMSNSNFTWQLEQIELSELNSSTGQLVNVKRLGVSYTTPHNNKIYYYEYIHNSNVLTLKDLNDNTIYHKQ